MLKVQPTPPPTHQGLRNQELGPSSYAQGNVFSLPQAVPSRVGVPHFQIHTL